jgi:hypothetical protein
MKTLTTTEKRAIARDWKNALKIYDAPKTMWLLKRNGPVLTGINLSRSHGGMRYEPRFHIHTLWRRWDNLTLSCLIPLMAPERNVAEAFTYLGHQTHLDEAIKRFERQCPYAFMDRLSSSVLDVILDRDIASERSWPATYSFIDSVLNAVYCGNLDEAETRIKKYKKSLLSWSPDVLTHNLTQVASGIFNTPYESNVGHYNTADDFEKILRSLMQDRSSMDKLVEDELVKFKLDKLKDHGFVCD